MTIVQNCHATTAEHAAREVAWRLIRWDAEKDGPLVLTVTDDSGYSVELTTEQYAPVFTWDSDGGISGVT